MMPVETTNPDIREIEAEYQSRWRILEMVAQKEGLEKTLGSVGELVESRCRGSRCAVMLLRDDRLYHSSGQPQTGFLAALDGLPTESPNGHREAVVPFGLRCGGAADVTVDPQWGFLRSAAQADGVRGCWWEPIESAAGEVLGALVVGLPEVRQPLESERTTLQVSTHVAGIAIEQRNMMADLAYQAHHDPTTRLPNRFLFEERLQQAIMLAGRTGDSLGLLHIDLDRFQTVNDLLGRQTGDLLLEQVARRIEPCLRASDTLARTSADEFAILLPALDHPDGVRMVADRVRQTLDHPFALEDHELTVTASIGYAVYPGDAQEAADLARNADTAMYRAKRLGRNCVQKFEPGLSAFSHQRVVIESSLGRALARGELRLLYQQQIDLKTGKLAGVEALLRWKHPIIGAVSPGTFIPIAEETGLIVSIGEWALREACRQGVRWRSKGVGPARIAVNVSGVQFARENFVPLVAAVLAETHMPPAGLELELTESALTNSLAETARKMEELKRLGVALAMDDFGTGYSSLSHLQHLPFDLIKVDQSFVKPIASASERPPIIESMVSMARALNKKVIAEGIETPDQQAAITAMGCDIGQGYLFGRAAEPETFE